MNILFKWAASQLHDAASVLMGKLAVTSLGMSVSTFAVVKHDFPKQISNDTIGLVILGCLFIFGVASGYFTKKLVEQKTSSAEHDKH
jgi:hypothetical protein